jgi:HSP20 family protein
MADRLNRAFDLRFEDADRESLGVWNPPVDIIEDKDGLVLKAELPGMDKKDIEVRVENNVLTLQGERKRESETKEDGYYRCERAYGTFSRSFSLPTSVDTSKIGAEYKDGVLSVSLPKAEEAKPKQIDVKVA